MKRSLFSSALGLTATLGLLAVGCGGGTPATGATVAAAEFEFTVNGEDFASGTNEITLENNGQQEHHVQFFKLAAGHNVEELTAVLADPTAGFPEWITADGGVGIIPAGGTGKVTQDLEAGTYALLCFVQDPADGAPHFAKGMATSIEIGGGSRSDADLPDADVQFSGSEYAFDGPTKVEAGEVNIGFRNSRSSSEIHEAGLVKLADGVTIEMLPEALAAEAPASGPPPFEPVGGLQAYAPGGGGVATIDLEAGSYALVCFVPNAEGIPHAVLGMVAPLKVE